MSASRAQALEQFAASGETNGISGLIHLSNLLQALADNGSGNACSMDMETVSAVCGLLLTPIKEQDVLKKNLAVRCMSQLWAIEETRSLVEIKLHQMVASDECIGDLFDILCNVSPPQPPLFDFIKAHWSPIEAHVASASDSALYLLLKLLRRYLKTIHFSPDLQTNGLQTDIVPMCSNLLQRTFVESFSLQKFLSLLNLLLCYEVRSQTRCFPPELLELAEGIVMCVQHYHGFNLVLIQSDFAGSKEEIGPCKPFECNRLTCAMLELTVVNVLQAVVIGMRQAGKGEKDLSCLRTFVADLRRNVPFGSDYELIVGMFQEHDENLIKSSLCILDVATLASKYGLEAALSPHLLFVHLLSHFQFDQSLLLDFLISNETCFLLYLLKYVRCVISEWTHFEAVTTQHQLPRRLGKRRERYPSVFKRCLDVLLSLRVELERLNSRDMLPFNATPLLSLMTRMEELYGRKAK